MRNEKRIVFVRLPMFVTRHDVSRLASPLVLLTFCILLAVGVCRVGAAG
jgi:hypothetical protein